MAQISKRTTANGDPRYDVRVRINGRVVTRTFRRRKDADAYVAIAESERVQGMALDPKWSRATVIAAAEAWLSANPDKRPTTWVADELAIRRYIAPLLGSLELGKVTPALVQASVNEWATHLAPRTVRRHYGVLRAMFAFSVENDWLRRSPCRGIKLPRVTSTRRFRLEPEQVAALVTAMPPQHRPIVWLGALLGLRWSEVAGLRVGRLELDAGRLSVVETVTRGPGGRLVFGPPKSEAGRRTIPIPAHLRAILRQHLADRQLLGGDPAALVFADSRGGPLSYSRWRRRVWLPACEAAGCVGAGFHDLRRANATGMVVEGVDIKTAQERLGHADVRMTLEVYAEATEAASREASEALAARFLRGSAGSQPKVETPATETPPAVVGRRPRDGRAMGGIRTNVTRRD